MNRKTTRRGSGKRVVQGKDLRLADEVRYIQNRAADHDARIITLGPLVLFSTETGDAWLLDPADHLALRLARDGEGVTFTRAMPLGVTNTPSPRSHASR